MGENQTRRSPRVFDVDDVKLEDAPRELPPGNDEPSADPEDNAERAHMPTLADVKKGMRWGALFLSAALALSLLAMGLWFERFVSVTLARDDWFGWLALGLVAIMAFAALMIIARELFGLYRLSRLKGLRGDMSKALAENDAVLARKAVNRLINSYGARSDLKWSIANYQEHDRDVLSGKEILMLSDRNLGAPIDGQAKTLIAKAAKRVSVVTALSPAALIDVIYVLIENLRMLRGIAGLYGGRPGWLGSFRLARMVVLHIAATGGLALADDLLGQFVGQDLVRRLSRRAGEGVFNGALTARIGIATINVCRPLPHLDTKPPRFREFAAEIFKRKNTEQAQA